MKRRKKLIDPEQVRAQREEAETARRALEAEREKVQRSSGAIMDEVRHSRRLLRENNFARRMRNVLGGAEG